MVFLSSATGLLAPPGAGGKGLAFAGGKGLTVTVSRASPTSTSPASVSADRSASSRWKSGTNQMRLLRCGLVPVFRDRATPPPPPTVRAQLLQCAKQECLSPLNSFSKVQCTGTLLLLFSCNKTHKKKNIQNCTFCIIRSLILQI